MISFIDILEYVGTFAFAISGIRVASNNNFDLFGAYVVGLVTAIGGGTIRDLLLGVTPFWMMNPSYVIITSVALLFVILFQKHLVRFNNTFFIFDTVGLGLFVVVGFEKTMAADFPYWVALILGTITGAAGGVTRDVLANEVPLIFRKEIYAMACVIGGLTYIILDYFSAALIFKELFAFLTIVIVRVLAVKFNICLPVLKSSENPE